MKGIIKVIMIGLMGLSMVGIASAAQHNTSMNKSKKWVCETNASAASTDADKKADERMKKGGSGKSAFDFALSHCRDCTKITCSAETTTQ